MMPMLSLNNDVDVGVKIPGTDSVREAPGARPSGRRPLASSEKPDLREDVGVVGGDLAERADGPVQE